MWAIEKGNKDNTGGSNPDCAGTEQPAALHAFSATNLSSELYSSRGLKTAIGNFTTFSTPTIFQGRVYMGTATENAQQKHLPAVDVFGLCPQSGCMPWA